MLVKARCACGEPNTPALLPSVSVEESNVCASVTDKCPFVNLPETGRARWGEILDAEKMNKCVWVRPKQLAVVQLLEWTEGDRLRHSKFVGLRDDKEPQSMVKEHAGKS
jgi:hypothetical protein